MESNKYTIKNKKLTILLEDIESVINDLCGTPSEGHSCHVNINKSSSNSKLYNAEIELRDEKQKDKKRVVPPIEPPTLL